MTEIRLYFIISVSGSESKDQKETTNMFVSIVVLTAILLFCAWAIRRVVKAGQIRRQREMIERLVDNIRRVMPNSIFNRAAMLLLVHGFVELPKIRTEHAAQSLVDQALKQYAILFRTACREQEAFRRCMESQRREAPGRFSRAKIEDFKKQESAGDAKIKEAKDAFWGFHEQAADLGFQVWESHQDYLLLM